MAIELLEGNEACAEGAIAAGCRFFAGYPITPSTEIAEYMSEKLPQVSGKFIQMEDEIASMGAIIGGSLAGVKAMTATSGPGFSLMQENIGYAIMGEIPCVVVNVQRGGPSTGLPTYPSQADVMQARWGTHGDHDIIVLSPSTVEECFFETVRAFNLAEQYRTPVIVLTDEVIGHMSEKVKLPDDYSKLAIVPRKEPSVPPEQYLPYDDRGSDVPPLAIYGKGYRFHVTGLTHDVSGFPTNDHAKIKRKMDRLRRKISDHVDEIASVKTLHLDDAKVAIFAYGSSARTSKQVVMDMRAEGKEIGLMNVLTMWPFPEKQVRALAAKVHTILVPELNFGQIIYEVERCAAGKAKVMGINRYDGDLLTPEEIVDYIKKNVNL
jgi:2-oxoglutarate ferredoxin oxidoreductase subunit alpha